MITLLGVDTGFAALGYAKISLTSADPGSIAQAQMGVLRTAKTAKKKNVYAADDNLRRIAELARDLDPLLEGVAVVCIEAQSWPRNASVSAKIGMAWGLVGALCARRSIPIVQVSPQNLKKALTGKPTATKEEVETGVRERFSLDFETLLSGVPGTMYEHAFDALGAVVASWDSEVLQLLRKMI